MALHFLTFPSNMTVVSEECFQITVAGPRRLHTELPIYPYKKDLSVTYYYFFST